MLPLTRRVRVVTIKDTSVLVVDTAISSGKWALPGGGIKFGESPLTAAKREVREELGVELSNCKLLQADPVIVHEVGLLLRYHFVVANVSPASQIKTNWEVLDHKWLPLAELEDALPEVGIGVELSGVK